MDLLAPNIQHYHWGDYSFIPELQGRPIGDQPEAELWMGVHPLSPSKTLETDESLNDIISNNRDASLGPWKEFFGDELPYILKVLAIREPLSIQVHPTAEQAEEGFTSQQSKPEETGFYTSSEGKEEVVCALTETDLKFGFRDQNEIHLIIDAIGSQELHSIWKDFLEETLDQQLSLDHIAPFKEAIANIFEIGPDQIQSITAATLSADMSSTIISEKELKYFADLAQAYPGDPGLLIFLFMNFVTLEVGDFLHISPGETHAYLCGNVVEVTSNSDNVIRCGLTPKDVNAEEYLSIGDIYPWKPRIQKPEDDRHTYTSPTPFTLSRLNIEGEWSTRVYGPEILISTQNAFTIENESGQKLQVGQGQPVWIPFSDHSYTVTGDCLLFRCATKDYGNDVHNRIEDWEPWKKMVDKGILVHPPDFMLTDVPKVFRSREDYEAWVQKNLEHLLPFLKLRD
tara:strand:+ start:103 stop:1470 length:1368 start_codon:yes stop_codon:yes gene_type:complete